MIKKILISLSLLFSSAAMAQSAANIDNFSGKYRVITHGQFSTDAIEFLVNSKNQIKVIYFGGDEAFGAPLADFQVSALDNNLGPVALPLATLTLAYGSDEETHTFVIRLAHEVDFGRSRIALVDTLYTVNDGPNEFTSIRQAKIDVQRWNKATKKYEEVSGF